MLDQLRQCLDFITLLVHLLMTDNPTAFDQIGVNDLNRCVGFACRIVVLDAVGAFENLAVYGNRLPWQRLDTQKLSKTGSILLVVQLQDQTTQSAVRGQSLFFEVKQVEQPLGIGLDPVIDSEEAAITSDDGHGENRQT